MMRKMCSKGMLLLLAAAVVLSASGCSGAATAETESSAPSATASATTTAAPSTTVTVPPTTAPKGPFTMEDALFIGDSRTVGLMEYAELKSDFFCNVGMSVYSIHKKPVSVPNVGKVTLKELLSHKKYGKIYLMLGINEVGYNLKQTVGKYQDLIDTIRRAQPDAYVFIQANLHVTEKKSNSEKYVNNPSLNRLNEELKKLADGKKVLFLDVNSQYDDDNGNLKASLTSDGVHLYAKYYVEWAKWISDESRKMIQGG